MLRKAGGLAALSLLVTVTGLASAQDAVADPPVVVPLIPGIWVYRDSSSGPVPFARSPELLYQAQIFPRLTRDLIRFECRFPGTTRVDVTGLIPAQRFPQPRISLRVGTRRWSATPDALYIGRSQPTAAPRIPDSALDDNLKGRDLSWPGHPPYASLRFFTPPEEPLAGAIAGGSEVQVTFEGQERRFPGVPAETAERFARACAALAPPARATS